MNWFSIVVYGFLILCIINGFRRGLIKTVISMLSVVLAMILVSFLNPYVSEFLTEHTPIYRTINERCQAEIGVMIEDSNFMDVKSQAEIIKQLPLPKVLIEKLEINNTQEGYGKIMANNFAEYLSHSIAVFVLKGLSYVGAFILAIIIIKILTIVLSAVVLLPGLNICNWFGGGIAGAIQGLLIICVVFLGIMAMCGTKWGISLYHMIQKDPILLLLYNENILLRFIQGMMV